MQLQCIIITVHCNVCVQVFTRLNHLDITLSYSAVLKLVLAISKLNEVPLHRWIESKAAIKFIGDNVNVAVGV